MTDQELLHLAALAAKHELKWSHEWPRIIPGPLLCW